MFNNSAADCSILLTFGTKFSTHDARSNTNVQGQMSRVKLTAWKRRLIAKLLLSFRKSGSLNLRCQNFDRKLRNSTKIDQNSAEGCATLGGFKLQCIRTCHIFYVTTVINHHPEYL